MNIPITLSTYIARQFLQGILLAWGGLMLVVVLLDAVELIRRTAGKPNVGLSETLEMAIMKTPEMALKIVPFAVLIGGMLALTRLSRNSELVVARASGVSVWQFLRPAWALALVLGMLFIGVANPIAAAMLERFEQLEARYISGRPSLLAISDSGLWLRDFENKENGRGRERIFHALRLSQQDMTLYNVIVFRYDEDNGFLGRVDAETARLHSGYWLLENAILSRPGQPPENLEKGRLRTELTLEQIQDSFASPETLSFWELPAFIGLLEESGFSAIRHKLHWQATLASPLLLIGMIFIAAVFSLRMPRRGGIAVLVAAGAMTGFVIYFLSDLIYALGLSGSLPVVLAAWIPAIVTLLAGVWMMIHLEY